MAANELVTIEVLEDDTRYGAFSSPDSCYRMLRKHGWKLTGTSGTSWSIWTKKENGKTRNVRVINSGIRPFDSL